MKRLLPLLFFLFVTPVWAFNPEQASLPSDGRMRVVVEEYEVEPADISTSGFWGGNWSSEYSLDEGKVGHDLAEWVRREMVLSQRFDVRAAPQYAYQAAAFNTEAGSAPDLDYVVQGRIENLKCHIDRNETRETKRDRDGKECEEITTSYSVSLQLTVLQRALESQNGNVWKQVENKKSASATYSSQPSERELTKLAIKAAKGTARPFVRTLVPAVEGRVVSKTGDEIVIDLGRLQGVGTDVDFTFARDVEAMDEKGQPVVDQDGKPTVERLLVAVRPNPKNDKPFPSIGRPQTIDTHSTIVRVGYNGSGGFFGPEYEWKRNANNFAAVREGDIVILTPRPGDAK